MAQFQNKKTGETRFVDDSPKTARIMLAKGWQRVKVKAEPEVAAESAPEAPKPAKSKSKAEAKDA